MNYAELATNAITIECVKSAHENSHAPVYQVNTKVSHWNISAVNINGAPIADWCEQFGVDLQEVFGHYFTARFNTKKSALAWAVETFAIFIEGIDPEENWHLADEALDQCTVAFTSIKGGK